MVQLALRRRAEITGKKEKEKQHIAFIEQIKLANELEKPIIPHPRNGKEGNVYKEAYDILKEHANVPRNSHFFAKTPKNAKRF